MTKVAGLTLALTMLATSLVTDIAYAGGAPWVIVAILRNRAVEIEGVDYQNAGALKLAISTLKSRTPTPRFQVIAQIGASAEAVAVGQSMLHSAGIFQAVGGSN